MREYMHIINQFASLYTIKKVKTKLKCETHLIKMSALFEAKYSHLSCTKFATPNLDCQSTWGMFFLCLASQYTLNT